MNENDKNRGISPEEQGIQEKEQALNTEAYTQNRNNVEEKNALKVLIDGEEIFKEYASAIRNAQHYIYLSAWALNPKTPMPPDNKPFSYLIQETLKKNKELHIYILWSRLFDSFEGGFGRPEAIRYYAEQLFGEFLNKRGKVLIAEREILYEKENSQNKWGIAVHHVKSMICDGRVGFCGSADIMTPVASGRHEVTVKTTVAAGLELEFISRWNQQLSYGMSEIDKGLVNPGDQLEATTLENFEHIFNSSLYLYQSNPFLKKKEILDTYYWMIEKSTEYIYIENQYFRHVKIAEALRKWLDQNKKHRLTILLPGLVEEIKDIDNIDNLNKAVILGKINALSYLTRENKKNHKIQPLRNVQILSPKDTYRPYIHSKLIITDPNSANARIMLGSANLNPRGLDGFVDNELNVMIDDSGLVNSTYQRLKNNHQNMHLIDHKIDYRELEKAIPKVFKLIFPAYEPFI